MKIGRRDYRRLLQAIWAAIENRHALISAHRVRLVRRANGQMEHVVPKEHCALVKRCRRDIRAWRDIAARMNGEFL